MKQITRNCAPCGGTGREMGVALGSEGEPTPYDNPCGKCGGTGKLPHSELSDDLIDFLNDLKNKVDDIFEKVNE